MNSKNLFIILKLLCLTSSSVFGLENSYYSITEVYDLNVFEEKTDEKIYHKWVYPKHPKDSTVL